MRDPADDDAHSETLSATSLGTGSYTRAPEGTSAPQDPDAFSLPLVPPEFYDVGEEHARGGLGKILVARDRRLGRTVALKQLIVVAERPAKRLVREARLTARLQHPGIVPVYEAGFLPEGVPFYSMKLVSGRSLRDLINEQHDLRARLSLLTNMVAVAEAIAYAHSRKVIHRDLKPSNVLVGEFGETVVVDWGLAKDIGDADDDRDALPAGPYRSREDAGGLTVAGAVLGTPAYMPPEQARGEDVDERADVYALGAMLYHLLAGQAPYSGSSEEVLDSVRAQPPPPIGRLVRDVPADLVAIVERAMAREPSLRYAHAGQLAEDLTRFQTGQLVGVHDYSLIELTRRWIAKRRSLAIAAALFLVAALAGASLFLVRERRLRDAAEAARAQSDVQRARADGERDRSDRRETVLMEERGRDELERGNPSRAAVYFAELLRRDPTHLAYRALASQAVAALASVRWSAKHRLGFPLGVAFSHDGSSLLAWGTEGAVVLDVATGKQARPIDPGGSLYCASFSADDARLVTGYSTGEVVIWEVATGARLRLLTREPARVNSCEFAPSGRRVLVASSASRASIWDADSGQLVRRMGELRTGFSMGHYSPQGDRVLVGFGESFAVFDAETGRQRFARHTGADDETSVDFDPTGDELLVEASGQLERVDARTGRSLQIHESDIDLQRSTISARRRIVVGNSPDGDARIWSFTRRMPIRPRAPDGSLPRALFLGDEDEWLVGLSEQNRLRILNAAFHVVFSLDLGGTPSRAFTTGHGLVAMATGEGVIYLIRPPLEGMRQVAQGKGFVFRIAYTPAADALVLGNTGGSVTIAPLGGGEPSSFAAHAPADVYRVAVAPDGSRLVTSGVAPSLNARLWDARTHALVAELEGHTQWTYSVAYSPDSQLIATAGRDFDVRLWDGHTGAPVGAPLHDAGQAVTFSPDGKRLVTGLDSIQIWDLATRRPIMTLEGHPETLVEAVSFDRSGRFLVSGGWDDHLAKIWDTTSGKLVATLHGHLSRLMAVALSPDGSLAATASYDGTGMLWDAKTGELLRTFDGPSYAMLFSPDGTHLLTAIDSGVYAWDIRLDPRTPEALAAFVDGASGWRMDSGRLVEKPAAKPAR